MQFHFESSSHQRFENNIPVRGHQVCNRAVKIEPNLTGCSGYKIMSGDGVIISILNLDGNHPLWGDNYQMSPKPMRVVEQTENSISFRGYEVLAQTPFGWQAIDLSDYGVTIYLKNGIVTQVRLDMFDRNTYIEYYV